MKKIIWGALGAIAIAVAAWWGGRSFAPVENKAGESKTTAAVNNAQAPTAQAANAQNASSMSGATPGAAPGAAPAAPPTTVTTTLVSTQDVPVNLEANGTVVAQNATELRAQITNTIQKIHIKEGQFVRAGETVISLDDRADRANLEKADAQLLKDQATLADLERQLKRSQDLVAQKFIAQSAADSIQTQVDAQRAAIRSDQAAITSGKVSLSYNTIKSPINGRVGAIGVFAGSLAQPNTPLFTITQLNPISVSFPVPEGSLPALMAGMKTEKITVTASSPTLAKPLRGVLNFVDSTIDATVGTIRAKATFANPEFALWPGQYVTARITTKILKDAVVIPLAAVVTNANGKSVYVVGADQAVKPQKIEFVYEFGNSVAITGLQGGEKIVLEGKQNLRPGGKVREAEKRSSGGGKPNVAAANDNGKTGSAQPEGVKTEGGKTDTAKIDSANNAHTSKPTPESKGKP